MLPLIRADLNLSDAQLGLIASVLIWTLGVLFPIAGYAGDIFSKKWIITSSLMFWSTATLCTGFGTTAMHLALLRGLAMGGGEAFYAPSAFALIARFHHKTRALAMSIHQTSLYVGVTLSGFLGGFIGQTWGWRAAFYCFGACGMLMAILLAFRLKDPPTDVVEEVDSQIRPPHISPLAALSVLVRTPTALLLTLAYTGMIFVYIGYMTWTTTFLFEKFDLSLARAGFFSMFYFHLFALVGVLVGGLLSDYWAQRRPVACLATQCVGLLLSAPFIYIMGMGTTQAVTYIGLAGYGLFRGVYDSNIYVSLYCVIERRYHASATGVMTMFGFMVGAFSPYLLGLVKPTLGLSAAFAALSVVHVFSAAAIFLAMAVFFTKDHCDESENKGGQL